MIRGVADVVVQKVVVHVRGDAETTAHHQFLVQQTRIPCESDTRIDIVLGGGVKGSAVSVLVGQFQRAGGGIDVGELVVDVVHGLVPFPAHTIVDGETGHQPEVILGKEGQARLTQAYVSGLL